MISVPVIMSQLDVYSNYMLQIISTNLRSVSCSIWTQVQTRDYFLNKQQNTKLYQKLATIFISTI